MVQTRLHIYVGFMPFSVEIPAAYWDHTVDNGVGIHKTFIQTKGVDPNNAIPEWLQ